MGDSKYMTASACATVGLRPTIFHEPWWLDAASDRRWSEVTVEQGGRTVARLPLFSKRRWGLLVQTMPPLTHVLGPAIDEGAGSATTRDLRRMNLLSELIGKLPPADHFTQTCHRELRDVVGFQARGFHTATQFNVEIEPAAKDVLWRSLRDKTRNVIRQAEKRGEVISLPDPDEFVRFYARNLEQQRATSYFDLTRIKPIYEAAAARGQVEILATRTAEKNLSVASLFVHDAHATYYLLTTRDPKHADNGAAGLIVWQAMTAAAQSRRLFDFYGITSHGTARFYAGFGGRFSARHIVLRSTLRYESMRLARRLVKGEERNFFSPT
jgi:hypothetical protein